jgi:hypothetical protein
MRKDLPPEPPESAFIIVAPADIRQSAAVPMRDESKAERQRRDDIFFAVLGAAIRPPS